MRTCCSRLGRAVPLLLLLVSVPLSAVRPPASPAPSALPSARSVIDRHIEAIGGRKAVLGRSSTRAAGTISVPSAGLTGTVEVLAAKPNKTLMRISIGGIGDIEEGFNGTVGWSLSAITGPALLEGKQLEQRRFDSDFFGELHDDARYESMTTVEETEFEGRSCYKLRLVRKGGGEDFEFYDVKTGLKAGSISTRTIPMGDVTSTTVESDYRRFGNVLTATSITLTGMGMQQLLKLNAVEIDSVDPSVFEPPAPIKALLK